LGFLAWWWRDEARQLTWGLGMSLKEPNFEGTKKDTCQPSVPFFLWAIANTGTTESATQEHEAGGILGVYAPEDHRRRHWHLDAHVVLARDVVKVGIEAVHLSRTEVPRDGGVGPELRTRDGKMRGYSTPPCMQNERLERSLHLSLGASVLADLIVRTLFDDSEARALDGVGVKVADLRSGHL
jgi:hypothetical protein